MPAYVDKIYYDNEYKGIAVDDVNEFDQLALRSSEIVDQVTGYKIKDIESLHPFFQTQVKKAVCAQIEHFEINGGYESTKEGNALGNVNIGSFSYSSNGEVKKVPSNVIDFLRPTGLLYSGVGTFG